MSQRHPIALGSRVDILDTRTSQQRTYRIVPMAEADPTAGRIGLSTPIAQALLGRTSGQEVSVRTPGGLRTLRILDYF